MAVIWREKGGYTLYVTPSGEPPTQEDIELAKRYDEELRERIKELTSSLREKGFFEMEDKMKKWYLLGKGLQFLDRMVLMSKCDPTRENTWRALYDIAPHLAPRETIPTDKERASGKRNHFYRCYLLGKIDWERIRHLKWANWNDIYMSFSPNMWNDAERLLKWILERASTNKALTRSRLRFVLKALRKALGERAKVQKDTTVLSTAELYYLLDEELEKVKAVFRRQ